MSQYGTWPCGCSRDLHAPGPCPNKFSSLHPATPSVALYEECLAVQDFPTDEVLRLAANQRARFGKPPTNPISGAPLAPEKDARIVALEAEPEIPVTEEMIAAGEEAAALAELGTVFACSKPEAIYRAMAALAPVELVSEAEDRIAVLERLNASLSGRVGELESYSHELAKEIDRRNYLDQQSEAYQYLKRLFLHMAPQCCVLPDLLGVCTQVDNAIAGLKMDINRLTPTDEPQIANLEAEVSQWKAIAQKATDAFNQAVQDSWDLRDRRMVAADDAGNHNYHGPIKDGKAIPDETHERFHGAIGDVLAGNVIRPARDQMERALADAKAKDDKTPQPLRPITSNGDRRRIGWPA